MLEYEARREAEKAKEAEVKAKLVKVAEILKQPVAKEDKDNLYDCRVSTPFFNLSFSAGYGKQRVNVRGNYPRNADGSYVGDVWYTQEEREARKAKGIPEVNYGKVECPSITISAEKDAEQIAKDIQRRFLPDYLDYRKRLQERIDDTNDYQSVTKKSLESLKKGGKLTEYEIKEKKFDGYVGKDSTGVRYEVKASREEISVELSNLSVEQAKLVLAVIKK